MIVPEYWAEARFQQPRGKGQKQITVRRFGWSNDSQAEAEQMAGRRAQDGLKRIAAGESLFRREPKIPYNGAEGVPIREEVLSRQDDVVITRNSYGAHCLNTPDVLFADIDFQNLGINYSKIVVGLDTNDYFESTKFPYDLGPKDYLDFARLDHKEKSHRGRINATANAKRAIDCEIDWALHYLKVDIGQPHTKKFCDCFAADENGLNLKLRISFKYKVNISAKLTLKP